MLEQQRSRSRSSNLYEVLQVSPEASIEVIRAAYRALARAYHPDVNADPEATPHMRRLNAAYQVLSDPDRRARYNAALARTSILRSAAREARPSARGTNTLVRPSPVLAARGHHCACRVRAEPGPFAAVPASSARIGWTVLLVVAIVTAVIVILWGLGNLLEDRSPYEIYLDAAARPVLNRS
jgi:DnaJ domain